MEKTIKKIMTILSVLAIVLGVGVLFVQPTAVHASAKNEITNGFNDAGGNAAGQITDLPAQARTIINTMLFMVGMLSVVMIIYSGLRYITAHGDKEQINSAKNTLIYSIVGLVIAILAYAIVNWVMGRFN